MLSQFCVRSENEKQQTERPRGPCCRSFVFVLKMRSNKTEKAERAMLSQFCGRSENEKQQTEKT